MYVSYKNLCVCAVCRPQEKGAYARMQGGHIAHLVIFYLSDVFFYQGEWLCM